MITEAWVVLSWDAARPRGSVRLDGYYGDEPLAREVFEYEGRRGRSALLLYVADGAGPIPDELFRQSGNREEPTP